MLVAAISAFLLYGQGAWYWGTADRTVDDYSYTLAAAALKQGSNPYDTQIINDLAPPDFPFVFPYLYPPPLAIILSSVAALGPDTFHRLSVAWGVVLALVNAGLVWRLAGPLHHTRGWLLLIFAAIAIAGPVVSTIRLGQINSWVMLLVLLALWSETRDRPWGTGTFLAAAILLKLTPAVFIADLVFRARWKSLIVTMAMLVAMVGASIAVAGIELWSWYLDRVMTPLPFNPPGSIRGLATWALSAAGATTEWQQAAAFAGLTVCVAWMVRQLPRLKDAVSNWSFLALFSLLASPLTWHHHYYFALLPYTVGLVRRVENGGRPAITWVWLALAAATLLRYPGVLTPLKPIATFAAFLLF